MMQPSAAISTGSMRCLTVSDEPFIRNANAESLVLNAADQTGPTTHSATRTPRPWAIALAGLVALAVAMGIGRFAFTPLLPMMLHDGVVNLPQASWLASSNYFGYVVGAVLCTLHPWIWARIAGLPRWPYVSLVRAGLVATGVLTLAMAWHAPAMWPLLRFAAGVTSAVVFVFTSGWCMSQLARLGLPAMGALIYIGPGAGIVLSGLLATGMVAWRWTAAAGWLVFGLLAFALLALVWRSLRGSDERLTPQGQASQINAAPALPAHRTEVTVLSLAYGLAGFGYIITATFLPVIARAALPQSVWLDMFWPIFGGGVMLGALLASRLAAGRDARWMLAGCYCVQALGIACSLVSPSLAGFAVGSFLLGLPFTAITFFAMQEVRRLRPHAVASCIGLLTAVYGLGQVVGPPLAAALLRHAASAREGFSWSLGIAATSLLVGAAMYAWLARRYPGNPAR
jgi:MFS family permease